MYPFAPVGPPKQKTVTPDGGCSRNSGIAARTDRGRNKVRFVPVADQAYRSARIDPTPGEQRGWRPRTAQPAIRSVIATPTERVTKTLQRHQFHQSTANQKTDIYAPIPHGTAEGEMDVAGRGGVCVCAGTFEHEFPVLALGPGDRYSIRISARGVKEAADRGEFGLDDDPLEYHFLQLWREEPGSGPLS